MFIFVDQLILNNQRAMDQEHGTDCKLPDGSYVALVQGSAEIDAVSSVNLVLQCRVPSFSSDVTGGLTVRSLACD